jgi:hypothetical protein
MTDDVIELPLIIVTPEPDPPVDDNAIPGYYNQGWSNESIETVYQSIADLEKKIQELEQQSQVFSVMNEIAPLSDEQLQEWEKTKSEIAEAIKQQSEAEDKLEALAETSYQVEGQQDLTGKSRHMGHETGEWSVACVSPDVCKVGKSVVSFDSSANLGSKTRYSPDVNARGTPVYRVGDMSSGTQGNAGKHIVSGTSGGGGYVKFNTGHDTVIVNNRCVVRHDSLVQINCNAAGIGGALGQVITEVNAPKSQHDELEGQEDVPEGERTSPELERLKAEREALVEEMWDLDYTDKWVRFDETNESLDALIDEIQGEKGTAYDYAAQGTRATLGFLKDIVTGTAELVYEGVKLSAKMHRRLLGSNGHKLNELDIAILKEESRLGNITAGTLKQGAKNIGAAIVKPVTDPWKEGDYVESVTRGTLETATIFIGWLKASKARKAAKLKKDGTNVKGSAIVISSIENIKRNVISRIESSKEFSFTYSDADLEKIVTKGRALGLDDKTIEDLVFVGSRDAKRFDSADG